MSENNSEKTSGQTATALINGGFASKTETENHQKLHNDPTMTAEEFRQLPQTFGLKLVKKNPK